MPLLRNIGCLASCDDRIGVLHGAAVAWDDSGIRWVGLEPDLPAAEFGRDVDAGGRLVIPGLVDCHTHLAFGGWRADEFEQRALGAGYLEIAEAGGGIRSTMRRTREASRETLEARCRDFLRRMAALGVTTVEAKSGYGLTVEDELRVLRLYRDLDADLPTAIIPTLLGAHVVPPEFETADRWVECLIGDVLPVVQREGLARYCDIFVEEGAFAPRHARRLFEAATAAGLGAKLHVDQLQDGGGGRLAAEVGAVSADHLEYTSDAGMAAMAAAGVVAVALPIASLYLRQPPMDGRRFIEAGCAVAVATDFNPGSAPSFHLPLAMTLACTMNRLTPSEALLGATRVAARAVGLETDRGSLTPGKRADLALVDADSVNQWLYHFQPNAVHATYAGGRRVLDTDFG